MTEVHWLFAFHYLISALFRLQYIIHVYTSGNVIEGSGLDGAWTEAGICGPATTHPELGGNEMKKASDAHSMPEQVLHDHLEFFHCLCGCWKKKTCAIFIYESAILVNNM